MTYANVTQTGQMVKDLGIAFSSVPKGYVFDGMHTSRNLSYLSVSTLDTWVKKDVNKYRKVSCTENGRPNLEWGTLL